VSFTSLDDPGPEEAAALTLYEKVERLQDIFIWRGRNPSADNEEYKRLRRDVLASSVASKLPLVKRVRDIDAYWPIAKEVSASYAGRDKFVREQFAPALDALETVASPMDDV
jgi:hypothetical protein